MMFCFIWGWFHLAYGFGEFSLPEKGSPMNIIYVLNYWTSGTHTSSTRMGILSKGFSFKPALLTHEAEKNDGKCRPMMCGAG